jgi:hypothetical protein
MTMNDHWGYNKNDQHWKSTQTLIHNLVDCSSKGGNYLLNIGPTSDGEFPHGSIERLAEIGRWMKTNSESIYATTGGVPVIVTWEMSVPFASGLRRRYCGCHDRFTGVGFAVHYASETLYEMDESLQRWTRGDPVGGSLGSCACLTGSPSSRGVGFSFHFAVLLNDLYLLHCGEVPVGPQTAPKETLGVSAG